MVSVGQCQEFSPSEDTTVRELLQELGLEGKTFGVLVNGKKADNLNYKISKVDKIIILPQIAGGI